LQFSVSQISVLAIQPDEDALACKLITLIHLENFEDALKISEKVQSLFVNAGFELIVAQIPKLAFERAYCLFRLRRFDEALKVLSTISPKPPRVLHLEAQVVRKDIDNVNSAAKVAATVSFTVIILRCSPRAALPDGELPAEHSHLRRADQQA
jgi:hypothetical protein